MATKESRRQQWPELRRLPSPNAALQERSPTENVLGPQRVSRCSQKPSVIRAPRWGEHQLLGENTQVLPKPPGPCASGVTAPPPPHVALSLQSRMVLVPTQSPSGGALACRSSGPGTTLTPPCWYSPPSAPSATGILTLFQTKPHARILLKPLRVRPLGLDPRWCPSQDPGDICNFVTLASDESH